MKSVNGVFEEVEWVPADARSYESAGSAAVAPKLRRSAKGGKNKTYGMESRLRRRGGRRRYIRVSKSR